MDEGRSGFCTINIFLVSIRCYELSRNCSVLEQDAMFRDWLRFSWFGVLIIKYPTLLPLQKC